MTTEPQHTDHQDVPTPDLHQAHLWDAPHPHRYETGNHFDPDGCHTDYRTWGAFFDEYRDASLPDNLLVRWDWNPPSAGAIGELLLFWICQRKALAWSSRVMVHPDDEPVVAAFLRPRYEYLLSLWAPLAAPIAIPPWDAPGKRIDRRVRNPEEFHQRQLAIADAYRAAVQSGNRHARRAVAHQFGLSSDYLAALLRMARRPGRDGSPPLLEPAGKGRGRAG